MRWKQRRFLSVEVGCGENPRVSVGRGGEPPLTHLVHRSGRQASTDTHRPHKTFWLGSQQCLHLGFSCVRFT